MGGGYRIVLAEDHTILREGLRAIFAGQEDLEVVGEATDGREAVQKAEALDADLVLLDLSMPRTNGLEALEGIKRAAKRTRVLVLTVHKTEEYVLAALQAGADGYVLKDASSAELLAAVRAVLRGERYLSSQVAGRVAGGGPGGRGAAPARSPFDDLTGRERAVLKLVAEGYRNREIGDYLFISEKTVEKHRASLMRKLNLRSAQALTAYALDKGLVSR